MSFSWMKLTKNIKIKRTPSPTFITVLSYRISRVKKWIKSSMERISLPASLHECRKLTGSMTVEASILIPMVLFFFLHLMGFVEMLRLHGKLTFALWDCGNQLTVYAAMPETLEESIPDMAVSYFYVANRVKDFLGKDYMDTSPIVQGSKGLNYLASDYEEDCIDIAVTYQVKPQVTLFPFPYVRMVNRYYGHAWNGYRIQEDLHYVYVTLYGEVWHARADCSHIFITVQETDKDRIFFLRNEAGSRYSVCELCRKADLEDVVYFTDQGERYHRDKGCSALTRYISAIVWQESIPYRACSRCVEEEKE